MNVIIAQHTSTTAIPLEDRPWPRLLGRAAGVGAGMFAGAVVVGGAFNAGYSHRSDAMSSLAAHDASAPAVMTIGFAGLAVALLAAGAALLTALRGKAAVAGSGLILLAGFAAIVVGSARLDCSPLTSEACVASEKAGTVSGGHVVHNLASLVLFVALVIGLFVLAAALRRNPSAAYLSRSTRIAAFASLVLMVWFGSGAYGDNGGLVQRALVLVAVGWPVYLAARLTRRPLHG
jgi:hypothetical membrane protein